MGRFGLGRFGWYGPFWRCAVFLHSRRRDHNPAPHARCAIRTDFVGGESTYDVCQIHVAGRMWNLKRVLHRLVANRFIGTAKQQHASTFLLQTTDPAVVKPVYQVEIYVVYPRPGYIPPVHFYTLYLLPSGDFRNFERGGDGRSVSAASSIAHAHNGLCSFYTRKRIRPFSKCIHKNMHIHKP